MFIEVNRELRGQDFLPDYIADIPALYAGENIPMLDKIIWAHYYLGNSEWWLIELDPEQFVCFGFACLAGDDGNAEFGNFSLFELESLAVKIPIHVGEQTLRFEQFVERDLGWVPRSIGDGGLPVRFYRSWWEK
ncbi:DUF2958 domain-containing protein [Lacisediminihabitans sp. FW035]